MTIRRRRRQGDKSGCSAFGGAGGSARRRLRRPRRLLSVVDDKQQIVKLPFGSDFMIFVNGHPLAEPSGLKRGDRVTSSTTPISPKS